MVPAHEDKLWFGFMKMHLWSVSKRNLGKILNLSHVAFYLNKSSSAGILP
jgi:hypothetical protein